MINTPIAGHFIHGAADLEQTPRGLRIHRLPSHVRARDADAQLLMAESQPSGVRIIFDTEARNVTVDVHSTRIAYRGVFRQRGVVDVTVDGAVQVSQELRGGDLIELDPRDGRRVYVEGENDRVAVAVGSGRKRLEVWLPHNEQIDVVALRSDAPITPVTLDTPLWFHHGSSISQGSNAVTPTGIWPVVAARRADLQLHNLGFGGSALVDPFMARVIRDRPADLISVKLGINVANMDAMRKRSFVSAVHGFIDTIRDGHPRTPLVLISPIYCSIQEHTSGPIAIDPAALSLGSMRYIAPGSPQDTSADRLTLTSIREALAEVASARTDDPHLHYVSGLDLFGPADADRLPLPDSLHPSAEAHEIIGQRFADVIPAVRSR